MESSIVTKLLTLFHLISQLLLTASNLSKYIEDIYFFEVNTKYISSSVLKTSDFHECAARMKISMFSTHEMKYIWYLLKKSKFSFFFYTFF